MPTPIPVDLTELSGSVGGSLRLRGHPAYPGDAGLWLGVDVQEPLGVDDAMLRQIEPLTKAGCLTLMYGLSLQWQRAGLRPVLRRDGQLRRP